MGFLNIIVPPVVIKDLFVLCRRQTYLRIQLLHWVGETMTSEESSKSFFTRIDVLEFAIFLILLTTVGVLVFTKILPGHQFFVLSYGILAGFFVLRAVRNIPSRMIRKRTRAVILLSTWLVLLGLGSLGFTEIIDYNLSGVSLLALAIAVVLAVQLFVYRAKKTEAKRLRSLVRL